jgi:predicted ferric reductase
VAAANTTTKVRYTQPSARRAVRPARVAVRTVLLAGGLAVCGLWWLDTSSGSLHGLGDQVTAAGSVAGLVGAYLVLVQLLLLARLPWLERAVGLDRLAAWHRGLGTNVVIVLVAHVLLVVEGLALTEQSGTTSAAMEILTTYPDMLKALVGMVLFLAVGITSARLARSRLSYEAWYWVHVTAYLAVALTFFHQVSAGVDFTLNPSLRVLWIGLYGVVAVLVLWWRLLLPARRWFRHALTVERVVRESPDTVSVWLRGRHLDELDARPGQFFLWRFVTVGHMWSAHPYSLSAPVREKRMRITVKDAGDHSAGLARLHRGVPVFAEGPFGHFTADVRRHRQVLLIAGGSGIGPIRALAEQLLADGDDVVLLYRASTWEDTALRRELDAMGRSGLRTLYLIGRRRELRGDPLAARSLRRLVPDLLRRDVYICGPGGMTATVTASLRQLQVPKQHIHTEEFSLR